ncbi:peptidase A4 family-domain-containing protein [Mycena maculata]|uniref:Peptidase A4 family-domain-containing protein n=1 Tax=Mycena maculata TaxID=230809 RepID=A0AAD7I712_9AGAR|nr:peptidase A4 family-domain-containing protein [Mycena maculata]
MVFAASLFSSVLLATTAFAAPRGSGLSARVAGRRSGLRQASNGPSTLTASTDISHVEYSSNWAGASWESAAGTYKTVTGTFVVPTPSAPSGGSGSYAASAWVGIDGDTCDTGILQTGVDFTIDNGRTSYDAWYEFYPAASIDFSGLTVAAGDTITASVTATSDTAGTATITNETTGKTVTISVSSSAKLCGENAEWIVEDFEEGDSLVPFADFGTVTFTGAVATTSAGATVGPSGAVVIDIESEAGKVLTSVSTTSDSVTITYV